MSRVRSYQRRDVGEGVVGIHRCRNFTVFVYVGRWWYGAIISGAWITLLIDYYWLLLCHCEVWGGRSYFVE